ncbi:hypothetical protein CFE70_004311 [Pyrenophora teres f. teres 0-1]
MCRARSTDVTLRVAPSVQDLVFNKNVPSFFSVDWLVPVLKSGFPELNKVELVLHRSDASSERLEDFQKRSSSAQRLEAAGVTVKITENRLK